MRCPAAHSLFDAQLADGVLAIAIIKALYPPSPRPTPPGILVPHDARPGPAAA